MISSTFNPTDRYVWDSWFLRDSSGIFHGFFQQCDRSVSPSERFHNRVSIGHVSSHDLINWKEHKLALEPDQPGGWDDHALWSGCALEHDGKYYMFYTGLSNQDPKQQQIGLATSSDLETWQKHEGPILEPDINLYSNFKGRNSLGKPPAWRDPYVIKDPDSEWFYMALTARQKSDSNEYNGCIGLARSKDLIEWEAMEPIITPGIFDELEVPQIIIEDDKVVVLFSIYANTTDTNAVISPVNGLYGYSAKSITGPYSPIDGKQGLLRDYGEELYDLRLVRRNSESNYDAIGWINQQDGKFMGGFSELLSVDLKNSAD